MLILNGEQQGMRKDSENVVSELKQKLYRRLYFLFPFYLISSFVLYFNSVYELQARRLFFRRETQPGMIRVRMYAHTLSLLRYRA